MEPITRRSALTLGGVGAAFVIAGGAGLVSVWSTRSEPLSPATTGTELLQPALIRSTAGLLEVTLTAAPSAVVIGGTTVNAVTYNGSLPGPTLVVRPGDTLAVTMTNQLDDPTNLHTHGLHVSPEGSGDNVFRRIDAGATAEYRYEIPVDHPPGVFWYHPHHHGMAAQQVFAGLYGAIIVDDAAQIPASIERVLIVSDVTFDASGTIPGASQMERMRGREGTTVLLNGQVNPTMTAHPGERERWRIVNACTSRYLDLRLDGQALQLLGNDSGRFGSPHDVDSLLLMPGNRADVLVTMAEGSSVLQALPVDRGSSAAMMGGNTQSGSAVTLATLNVTGATRAPLASAPGSEPRDLRSESVDRGRTLTLAMGGAGMGGSMMRFTTDGRAFDAGRIDQSVAAGTIEEWTIVNTSSMDHPFHLHVWPMQVLEIGGQAVDEPTWQDVVNVPARSNSRVRIAFEDFTGTTVYHCHILDHEDNGMMGVIAVS
ncbi:MAG: multicopper oxidase family protein [Salinibacterium sp.]|nr:multicopper oxidase family protein [Salinibacterium sp.]